MSCPVNSQWITVTSKPSCVCTTLRFGNKHEICESQRQKHTSLPRGHGRVAKFLDITKLVHGRLYHHFALFCHPYRRYSKMCLITHLSRVSHIYASVNWGGSASGNGLSLVRRQAITWTTADLLSIGSLGTSFTEIRIEIQNFSFIKMHLKLSSAKWWPSWRRRWVTTIWMFLIFSQTIDFTQGNMDLGDDLLMTKITNNHFYRPVKNFRHVRSWNTLWKKCC